MKQLRLGVCLAMAALWACGSDSTTGPPGGGGTTEQWVTVSSGAWTDPSQTERFRCHGAVATSDEYFTGFRLASPSAVQTEVYVVVSPTAGTIGDFDCNLGSVQGNEAIYAAGPGTTELTFSGGKGVHVASGQYVRLVVHLVNNGDASVTDSTVVQGRMAKASDVTTPIDMIFTGTFNISIPSDGQQHTATGGCDASADFHIVADIPMMHSLGTHLTSGVTPPGDSIPTIFHDVTVDPQHELYSTLSSDLLLVTSDRVSTTCTYVNNTGVVISFGQFAGQESCMDGHYRYPPKPPTQHSPFACLFNESI